jgi:hypothetical protein
MDREALLKAQGVIKQALNDERVNALFGSPVDPVALGLPVRTALLSG